MAKLLPNRLSETMTEAQLKQFSDGIRMALTALPQKPALTSDEFAKIPKKGEAREKEAAQLIRIVRRFPQFLPTVLSLSEVEKDVSLYDQLSDLYNDHLTHLVDAMDFFMGLSGGEEMNAYSRFEGNVRAAAQDGDPQAIEALNALENVDRNRGGGVPKKAIPAVAKV